MACKAEDLRQIPLFALLDDDEMAVLAAQVEIKKFAARQRIYKIDEPGKHAYVMMSGVVRVATVDQVGKVVLKTITIARDLGRDIEIATGLTPDDRIIATPPDGLVDGMQVRIAK